MCSVGASAEVGALALNAWPSARLVKRMQDVVTAESQAAVLTLRGVSAVNRNDWSNSSQDFLRAYSLDPNNAFSLNNLGYVAEMDGDLETAEFSYEKTGRAQDANVRVGLVTKRSAEGMRLSEVVGDSQQKVGAGIEEKTEALRRQSGPIVLKRRDNNRSRTRTCGTTTPGRKPRRCRSPDANSSNAAFATTDLGPRKDLELLKSGIEKIARIVIEASNDTSAVHF